MNMHNKLTCGMAALAMAVLAGCGGSSSSSSSNDPVATTLSYDVAVTNLTNAQPLSPVAVVAHDGDYRVFTIGLPATAGLEVLAEGGSNTDLIAEADADDSVFSTASGLAPIAPAATETITVEFATTAPDAATLSVATMLVNTNDAFSGINRLAVGGLAVGESLQVRGVVYDAGTEFNSEAIGSIPGPADGGEGFNSIRDDIADQVTMHPGVVSSDDGYAVSTLNQQHRFDNRVVNIRVTRTN